MKIGVPREVKADEHRVALTPAGAWTLVRDGHQVMVETGAGQDSGYEDGAYRDAGAEIVPDAQDVWGHAELVIKVKEPQASEYGFLRRDLTLFTYLHLAAAPELTQALLDSRTTAIGYETVREADGSLPLLTPMSEVAGRMAPQIGAHCLEKSMGGAGVLLGGVPGVRPGRVVILGGGVVGTNAARIALGLGAHVTIVDINPQRLRELDDLFHGHVETVMSSQPHIAQCVAEAHLVIGAVLIPGARAPHLVTEAMVRNMQPGSVIVDVAVDQGGCIETADHVTTHSAPTYERFGVIHYAVANIPGAVPRTSTEALTNVTLPYIREVANEGLEAALRNDPRLSAGLNVMAGHVVCPAVAEAYHRPYTAWENLLA